MTLRALKPSSRQVLSPHMRHQRALTAMRWIIKESLLLERQSSQRLWVKCLAELQRRRKL